MIEKWKKIKGYEDLYEVSSIGRVKRLKSTNCKDDRILKFDINQSGYHRVGLYLNNKRTRYAVHRLVAKAFINNPKGKEEVNHKDNNPSNNIYHNLEWVTHQENVDHCIRQGRKVVGRTCKLSEENVVNIIKSELPQQELAKIYGMSKQQVSRIKRRESWVHIKNTV